MGVVLLVILSPGELYGPVVVFFLLGQKRGGGHADHTGKSGPVEAAVTGQK